nr:uncharacterized protein CI109_001666 [Kwoniella shandongensis]KAA5529727.1 hypothetical protein CI109_001666 [Kwoniella shandongensis]
MTSSVIRRYEALPTIQVNHNEIYSRDDYPEAGPSRSITRTKSAERTQTWTEELGSSSSWQDDQEEGDRLSTLAGPYGHDFWSISSEMIDSLVDELHPAHEDALGLPTAESVIAKNQRKSYRLESDDEDLSDHEEAIGSESESESQSESGGEFWRRELLSGSTEKEELANGAGPSPRSTSEQSIQPTTPVRLPSAYAKIPTTPRPTPDPILSIDDIIRRHSPAAADAEAAARDKARKEIGLNASSVDLSLGAQARRESGESIMSDVGRKNFVSSTKSKPSSSTRPLPTSVRSSSSLRAGTPSATKHGHETHRTSTESLASLSEESILIGARMGQALLDELDHESLRSSSSPGSRRTSTQRSRPSISRSSTTSPSLTQRMKIKPDRDSDSGEKDDPLAQARYLRSPHLNRTVTLPGPKPLRVSLAEVGNLTTGHPVILFLGLGCVRYLVALFDDIARAFNLRLICIDRWGIGKTDQIPQEKKDVKAWAEVVEQVLKEIGVRGDLSILAHSAGAPFALAFALRMEERIRGKIHLLAPWVSADIDGGYKWLKWIPHGVIRSATAAEWRLQSYLIGKPPSSDYKPIEHNRNVPITNDTKSSEQDRRTGSPTTQKSGSSPHRLVKRASKMFSPKSLDTVLPIPLGSSSRVSLNTVEGVTADSDNSLVSSTSSTSVQTPSHSANTSMQDIDTASLIVDRGVDFGLGEGFDSSSSISMNMNLPSPSTKSPTAGAGAGARTRPATPSGPSFTQILMQASHAECEPGTTSDLLSIILHRHSNSKQPWGFSYTQITKPVKIWYGTEDDKISERSMRWLERSLNDVELILVQKEGHGLMTSAKVMWEVFESLGKDAKG